MPAGGMHAKTHGAQDTAWHRGLLWGLRVHLHWDSRVFSSDYTYGAVHTVSRSLGAFAVISYPKIPTHSMADPPHQFRQIVRI